MIHRLIVSAFLCILSLTVFAQRGTEQKVPLQSNHVLEKMAGNFSEGQSGTNHFGKNGSFTNFPFIDYFFGNTPADTLWADKFVTVSGNSAVFNALNAQGNPYGGGTGSFGLCDELNSAAIDMNGSQNRTYIQFSYSTGSTWQAGDSLLLDFLTASGNYRAIWKSPDEPVSRVDVIIPFDVADYRDVNFRIRFVSYSTQSVSNTETFLLHNCIITDRLTLPFNENFLNYSFRDKKPLSINWSYAPVEVSNLGPLATNAVVFNMRDALNQTYNDANGTLGFADTLVSHLMNIQQFPTGDSVFLRFYYRSTDLTRNTDSLILQLRNNGGEWIRVWQGGRLNTSAYAYARIFVNFGRFRHANFQFRFINKGTYSNSDSLQFLVGGIQVAKKVYLPFIDDFSASTVFPDARKWITNSTYVNGHFPLNPPSLNVATFDGLDSRGQPYGLGNGYCDTLMTWPFNLQGLNISDSVYLSFYIQPKGLGERPNFGDSLIVQIRNNPCAPNQFLTIWNRSSFNMPSDRFSRVDILLNDSSWFHDDVQIAFRNIGSRTGNVNHWHVDYIQFDKGRTRKDTYRDIAVTTAPSSLLQPYASMPYSHYVTDTFKFTRKQQFLKVRNNDGISNPIDYSRQIRDPNASLIGTYDRVLGNFVTQTDTSLIIDQGANLTGNFSGDTLTFTSRYRANILSSSDNVFSNDQVEVKTHFSNFFSYDDGTAENGYGILNEPGAVALAFELAMPDSLFGISMFFNRAFEDVSTRTFDLMVWKDINTNGNGTGQTELKRVQFQSPQYFYQYNGFYYFKFDVPLFLPAGKFYVGWQQDQVYMLNVGWDENFDVEGKPAKNPNLAYRIVDFWYNTAENGTPMIRPIVGKWLNPPVGVSEIQLSGNRAEWNVVLYPNPAHDVVNIFASNETISEIQLFDLSGKMLLKQNGNVQTLQLPALQSGIYLVKLKSEQGYETVKKLIIKSN
jgi:hypothetical protein